MTNDGWMNRDRSRKLPLISVICRFATPAVARARPLPILRLEKRIVIDAKIFECMTNEMRPDAGLIREPMKGESP
jgi:hypothetical protein